MDLHRVMVLTEEVLFLPQHLMISTMCFMAIANGFVMSHSIEMNLAQTISVAIQNPAETPEILNRLKDYLNFQIPERFSYGDYSSNRTNRRSFKINQKITRKSESEQMKALTMLSFYIGYAISHITGKFLTEYYGAKCILAIALGFITILTLITSHVVHFCGLKGLIAILLLMGLAEGSIFPTLSYLRKEQRLTVLHQSKSLGVIMMILLRSHIAIILINLLSFALLSYFERSWIFHLFGVFVLLGLINALVFCHSKTTSIPHMLEEARMYSHYSITSATSASSTLHLNTRDSRTWTELFTTQCLWNFILTALQQKRIQNCIIVELQNTMIEWKPNLSDTICSCLKIVIPLLMMWLISILMQIFIVHLVYQNTMNASDAMQLKSLLVLVPRICSDFAFCLLSNENNSCGGIFKCTMSVIGTYYAEINLNSSDNSSSVNVAAGILRSITNDLGSLTNIIGPYVENLAGWEI